MKKIFSALLALTLVLSITTLAFADSGGFNEFGYNYKARIFVGPADGIDKALDGKVWGDPTYANDHLVMKWNAAWDACNDNGYDDPTYCAGAWTTNQYNGMLPDGSMSSWHYKIIWVGSDLEDSVYWHEGGYAIWGNYEVIQDFGFDPSGHYKYALARPGLGGK